MAIGEVIGLSLIGGAVCLGLTMIDKEKRQVKRELEEVFEINKIYSLMRVGENERKYECKITKIDKTSTGFIITLVLPKGYALQKFLDKVDVMEQATASSIKAKYIRGRTVKLTMGCIPVYESMEYGEHLIQDGHISIPYYTPFGIKYLDFHDEATCHMIVAGATRMGKTVFIRLLFANILKSTGGKVRFFYVNNKVEDYFPFIGIPQIPEPAETIGEAIAMMYQVRGEIMRRKSILRSKRDCVNVKQFNKKYPNEYIEPMFVVFDEYGRFIDDSDESQELQDLILEVSETAGYLDIHLVIATQRPDATTVLKPRIRANILSRVCFQTADEANSKIVVHSEDAFNLGEVAGRAIVLDGMRSVAQIPYISEEDTMDLLHEFRGNRYENKPERQPDNHVIEEIQSVEQGSDSSDSMPGSEEATCDSEPYYEEIKPRKPRSRGKKTKG